MAQDRYVGVRPVYRRSSQQRDFLSAFNPTRDLAGARATSFAGNDVYGAWNSKGVKYGKKWAGDRQARSAKAENRWRKSSAKSANRKEMFAGKDGSVYRRENGVWQKREGNVWRKANEKNGDDRVKTRKKTQVKKKVIRSETTIKRKTVKRQKTPHLRRTLDASKAHNRKTIQRRQLSTPRTEKRDRKAEKRLLREEKRR